MKMSLVSLRRSVTTTILIFGLVDSGLWLDVLAQQACMAAVEAVATIPGASADGRLQLSADLGACAQ
jgi:hypothetical protein